MKIEEKVFARKRFIKEKLLSFGFQYHNSLYKWEADFMNGDFYAVLLIDAKGVLKGSVVDKLNNEEYVQLRNLNMTGAYVNSVRGGYEKLLKDISASCCTDVLFAFDQANRITESILNKYDVQPDFPWGQNPYQSYGTFRHTDSGKWFALIMNIKWATLLKNKDENTVDVINLKINPDDSKVLLSTKGIYHGYHMNHKHWISVVLNDTLADEDIMKLVDKSFTLTEKKAIRDKKK